MLSEPRLSNKQRKEAQRAGKAQGVTTTGKDAADSDTSSDEDAAVAIKTLLI